MKIYERIYDIEIDKNGYPKKQKELGDFEIIQNIRVDVYTSLRIGTMNGEKYLIEEFEVTGVNGGSRFEVYEINQ